MSAANFTQQMKETLKKSWYALWLQVRDKIHQFSSKTKNKSRAKIIKVFLTTFH
jgi:hypothetical protein